MPPPQITSPPKAPLVARQSFDASDPYGLASLSDMLSLYNDPARYSSLLLSAYSYDDAYISSLMADISSIYGYLSYTVPSYGNPAGLSTATTAAPRTTNPLAQPTASPLNSNSNSNNKNQSKDSGLSSGAKIGIGVGVPLAVALLVGIGIFLWCAGKQKGKKKGTTIVAHPSQLQPPLQQQQAYMQNNQGYAQGMQQPMPPPQYASPQSEIANPAYGGYKAPVAGVVEMEQEYHVARPGVVELDASPQQVSQGRN
jgi:hypothetical protein